MQIPFTFLALAAIASLVAAEPCTGFDCPTAVDHETCGRDLGARCYGLLPQPTIFGEAKDENAIWSQLGLAAAPTPRAVKFSA